METNNTPTRIRIEDMTLGQIQGLKKEIAAKLNDYLGGLAEIISNKFDVGAIGFSVDTDLLYREYRNSPVRYDIDIHFSKEDI